MKKRTEQLAKAAVIGGLAGALDTAAVTVWMHRSYTHKSLKLAPPLETDARTVVWGTGTTPRAWAAVHRQHHEAADTPGDPHSPVQQGKWGVVKLYLKNTPRYTKASQAMEAAGEYPPDLQPDRLDKAVFNRKKLGLAASLAGHVGVNKAVGNPGYMGLVSWAVEKAFYVNGGNLVNSIGHAGAHPGKAIVTGEIEPNPDGSYGADSPWVAAITMGEGNQRYHHDHPESIYFGPDPVDKTLAEKAAYDLGGTIALSLIDHGMATAGEAPPT
jgi:stearoyl-CoA desaturase (delta-9 desaturase)